MAIHLGCPLPDTSSDPTRRHRERATPSPSYLILLRMGFARPTSHPAAGALLPHHFTLTGAPEGRWLIRPRADSGGVFSVALSLRSPSLAVSEHPALRSSDFPQSRLRATAAIQPAPSFIISYQARAGPRNCRAHIMMRRRHGMSKDLQNKNLLC